MSENPGGTATRRNDHLARLRSVCDAGTKICAPERATALLEAIIAPGDRVTLEGDNQKQADLLAAALANVDPVRVHDLHMVQSVLALPEHLSVFERGIARRLDFALAGPQNRKLAQLVEAGRLQIGAIHTYLELFERLYRRSPAKPRAVKREGRVHQPVSLPPTPKSGVMGAYIARLRERNSMTDQKIAIMTCY